MGIVEPRVEVVEQLCMTTSSNSCHRIERFGGTPAGVGLPGATETWELGEKVLRQRWELMSQLGGIEAKRVL